MGTDHHAASVFGALVADAATLGLHWIYDVERIAEVIKGNGGQTAFVPIDAANYEGVPAYFAHGNRADGMLSQYGECLALAVESIIANDGAFVVAEYQKDFADYFDMGGAYLGYIDRPTRSAVENIRAGTLRPSGSDDDQMPALTRLPAVIVALRDAPDINDSVSQAIEITNVNPVALEYGALYHTLLASVLEGKSLKDALQDVAQSATGDAQRLLLDAVQTDEDDSVAYGAITERACHLPQGMPLAFHIMARSNSFTQAIETNIQAGGDSCGRAIIIGSVMGALHGVGGPTGIPLDWILQTASSGEMWADCQALVVQ